MACAGSVDSASERGEWRLLTDVPVQFTGARPRRAPICVVDRSTFDPGIRDRDRDTQHALRDHRSLHVCGGEDRTTEPPCRIDEHRTQVEAVVARDGEEAARQTSFVAVDALEIFLDERTKQLSVPRARCRPRVMTNDVP
jgi:hypothetical protein